MDDVAVAERIIQARKWLHYSQKDTAALLEINVMTLNRYESGDRPPSSAFLVGLSALTECSLNWILIGKGDKKLPRRPAEQELISVQRDALDFAQDKIATLNHELEGLRKEMGRGKN